MAIDLLKITSQKEKGDKYESILDVDFQQNEVLMDKTAKEKQWKSLILFLGVIIFLCIVQLILFIWGQKNGKYKDNLEFTIYLVEAVKGLISFGCVVSESSKEDYCDKNKMLALSNEIAMRRVANELFWQGYSVEPNSVTCLDMTSLRSSLVWPDEGPLWG